jgi:hypothetical protein
MGVSIRSNNIGEEHYTRTILDDHRRRVRHVLVNQKPTRNGGEGVRLPMISNGIVFNDCETYCVADDEHRVLQTSVPRAGEPFRGSSTGRPEMTPPIGFSNDRACAEMRRVHLETSQQFVGNVFGSGDRLPRRVSTRHR